MARKKHGAHAGGHGWYVTFADLMGLLMSFFVMLVAFSTQDQQKLKIVAGSMREAFGVQTEARYSGVIESDGLPTRPKLKNTAHISPEDASNTPSPDREDNSAASGARTKTDREFALASASLRQALQDMPELTEISKHIMFEETKEGLNLEIIDQDGRSMFADGSKEPYERTRTLLQKLAAPLKATPLRVVITGHTAAGFVPPRTGYDGFDLSADRANTVRQILQREGLPAGHIFAVSGKSDTQPLFPDDPSLAANRRVTITLMREAPPLPPNLMP
ncbi:MAG: flagellar motor protein MotB [Xanthobacteraceae bacterium]|jgi:chemotaxis protein MotB